jgi:hypothetical protein
MFGAAPAFADEAPAPTPDASRTLADAGGVPNGGQGNQNANPNAGNSGNNGNGGQNGNGGGNGNAGGNSAENGNNGSVKIHGSEGDETTHNEPKVDCLNLTWFGYGETPTASVVVTSVGGQNPTVVGGLPSGTIVGGTNSGGEFNDGTLVPLPGLDTIDPGPNGMYHVRVEVTTTTSNGQSETKSKVVWVGGDCATTNPGGDGPGGGSGGDNLQDFPLDTVTPAVAPTTDVLGTDIVADTPAAPATPAAAPAAAPAAQVKGAELAFTGALTDRLVVLAGILLVLGGLVSLAGKERIAPARRR